MSDVESVVVRARGDEWTVSHSDLDRDEEFDEFDSAHSVAQNVADELGVDVEIDHPRNVDLRRLSA